MNRGMMFPPGMSSVIVRNIPPRLRADAVQEAWLALAQGRSPNAAVGTLLKREKRRARREGAPIEDLVDE